MRKVGTVCFVFEITVNLKFGIDVYTDICLEFLVIINLVFYYTMYSHALTEPFNQTVCN